MGGSSAAARVSVCLSEPRPNLLGRADGVDRPTRELLVHVHAHAGQPRQHLLEGRVRAKARVRVRAGAGVGVRARARAKVRVVARVGGTVSVGRL